VKISLPTLLTLAACAAPACAEPLFSNAGSSPSDPALNAVSISASGVAAPPSSFWSEATALPGGTEANAVGGFSNHAAGIAGNFRFADNFTVTDAAGWSLESADFFAYQPGASAAPFSGINVRIWSGRPGDPGATVLFGDTTTNRLSACTSTSIYRVFSSVATPLPATPDTSRLIWRTTANLGQVYLPPGTYWIDWQYTCLNPDGAAYSPPASVPGLRSQAGWNALQFRPAYGEIPASWTPIVDAGKPGSAADVAQDLPFTLAGLRGLPCDGDYNVDGNVDQGDIDYLINVVAGGANPTGRDPDFNRDGNVDQGDVGLLVGIVAGAPCPF